VLLRNIQGKWDQKQPVYIIKRQLAKEKFSKDIKTILELLDNKPLKQKRLIKTIITLLRTTLKKEVC
jgi:hypothetical protein